MFPLICPFNSSAVILTLNAPCIFESCVDIKSKLNFYMKAFKAFVKPFEAPQGNVKIKI